MVSAGSLLDDLDALCYEVWDALGASLVIISDQLFIIVYLI